VALDLEGLRANNPIADVVGRYIELKRAGSEYQARCPFHADRTPSFYVVPKKSKAFCMGCGWAGDVFDFLVEIERLSDDPGYPETRGTRSAVRKAAEMLGAPPLSADAAPARALPADRPAPAPLPPDVSEDWLPVVPVPKNPEPPFPYGPADQPGAWRVWNPKRDRWWTFRPVASWIYRDAEGRSLGWVARVQFDDGAKVTPTVTYCRHRETGEHRWCSRPFPSPRPLYGLDELAKRPDAPVLLVSGEKCRQAAFRLLPGFVAVTWPGGDRGVAHVDWTPLHGRAVTAWPDLDRQNDRSGARKPYAEQSGVAAMREVLALLAPHGGQLRELGLEDDLELPALFPDGWDVADAEAQGWTTPDVVSFCRPRVRAWVPEEKAGPPDAPPGVSSASGNPPGNGGGPAEEQSNPGDAPTATADPATPEPARPSVSGEVVDLPPQGGTAYQQLTSWSALDLVLSDKGVPQANLDNAARLLERHPDVIGRFWYDEFLGRILHTWNPGTEPAEWSDADDVRLALWVQRKLGIGRMAVGTVRDAVTAVAMAHRRNELRDWLLGLRWDGQPRAHLLLTHGFGAEYGPYAEAVGRCFLAGMAARGLMPGCKVDAMPVFEGKQGKGKSTALAVLVGERWFGEAGESVLSKDFFQALQGKWLLEIAEMDTFSRAEIAAVKRVITCRVDRYRAPYGRRAEDHPRMSVFAGTVNEDEYLRDATGARRFLPVQCGELDLGWIAAWREQLFAEAVAIVRAREAWWDVPSVDAEREQEQRRVKDEWESVIDQFLVGKPDVTVGEVLDGALGIKAESWDRQQQMRVATALKVLGWVNAGNARRNGAVVKVWKAPDGRYGRNMELL
jgi:putative DNA primase/helicase